MVPTVSYGIMDLYSITLPKLNHVLFIIFPFHTNWSIIFKIFSFKDYMCILMYTRIFNTLLLGVFCNASSLHCSCTLIPFYGQIFKVSAACTLFINDIRISNRKSKNYADYVFKHSWAFLITVSKVIREMYKIKTEKSSSKCKCTTHWCSFLELMWQNKMGEGEMMTIDS